VLAEVGFVIMDFRCREATRKRRPLLLERTAVFVYRVDHAAGSEELGQRQCKGAFSGTEISPYSAIRRHSFSNQADMIAVSHQV